MRRGAIAARARRPTGRPGCASPALRCSVGDGAGGYPAGVRVTVESLVVRDGPGCVWCGREPWRRDLTLEHVVPRARGGHLVPENAVLACGRCNARRGARPADAYVRELLRDGVEVNLDALLAAMGRLARSDRRRHREEGERQLRRLGSLGAS